MSSPTAISAANRFGLGARPGEIAGMGDAQAWLLGQLHGDGGASRFAGLPSSLDYLRDEDQALRQRRQDKQAGLAKGQGQAKLRMEYRKSQSSELAARYRSAVDTPAGFAERLVRFWSNHFAISVDKRPAALYAAPMEREAIRPNLFGPFSTLLLAVEQHPGMLRYLDNTRSVGADSMLAMRAERRQRRAGQDTPGASPGLNENLAREILELHTLGADGGYSQADVTEFARTITGWGVPMRQDFARGTPDAAFVFRAAAHAGGARTILGRRYAESGQAQGEAVLRMLAQHPATARHVSTRLACHLVADTPPPDLVAAMVQTWLDTGGRLAAVYATLVKHPAAWGVQARKFKTPDDYLVSAMRASGGMVPGRPGALYQMLARMGQPPFTPRSPAGFADTLGEWSGPDALFKRVQAAQSLAEGVPAQQLDPLATAQAVFAGSLNAQTATALRRAESPRDGLALLLASPAFQWRA